MSKWHTVLQNLFQFARALSGKTENFVLFGTPGKPVRKVYRTAALLTAGSMAFSVMEFSSMGFGGSGKIALAADAQIPSGDGKESGHGQKDETEVSGFEENERFAEGKMFNKTALLFARQLAGNVLEQKAIAYLETENMQFMFRVQDAENENTSTAIAQIGQKITDEAALLQAAQTLQEEKTAATEQEEKTATTEQAEKAAATEQAEKTAATVQAGKTAQAEQALEKEASADYQVLLNIVQAEAGNCDDKGKILVANVIMNRVKSSVFPDTITDVVYQRSQFSPVQNGSINRVQVTDNTIRCVERALAGEDYSQGALYFMNRSASRSGSAGWFDRSLTYLFQHGAHEFFK